MPNEGVAGLVQRKKSTEENGNRVNDREGGSRYVSKGREAECDRAKRNKGVEHSVCSVKRFRMNTPFVSTWVSS